MQSGWGHALRYHVDLAWPDHCALREFPIAQRGGDAGSVDALEKLRAEYDLCWRCADRWGRSGPYQPLDARRVVRVARHPLAQYRRYRRPLRLQRDWWRMKRRLRRKVAQHKLVTPLVMESLYRLCEPRVDVAYAVRRHVPQWLHALR
ncbi:hypothetical protein F6B41_27565 [Microbacterium lushaniae]|nr:hypothetical protein F6B41_27565 [Microbacterium lushaniae]